MNRKIIFTLLSPVWGRIHKIGGNFEHLAHESWPQTCGWIVLKLYKKQTKSEKHKFCHDIMISYIEAVVKIRQGFTQVIMYVPYKSKHLWRKSIELRRSRSDFESKWWTNWGLTSKLFVYATHNLDSFVPNFGYFLNSFDNYNLVVCKRHKIRKYSFAVCWHTSNLFALPCVISWAHGKVD